MAFLLNPSVCEHFSQFWLSRNVEFVVERSSEGTLYYDTTSKAQELALLLVLIQLHHPWFFGSVWIFGTLVLSHYPIFRSWAKSGPWHGCLWHVSSIFWGRSLHEHEHTTLIGLLISSRLCPLVRLCTPDDGPTRPTFGSRKAHLTLLPQLGSISLWLTEAQQWSPGGRGRVSSGSYPKKGQKGKGEMKNKNPKNTDLCLSTARSWGRRQDWVDYWEPNDGERLPCRCQPQRRAAFDGGTCRGWSCLPSSVERSFSPLSGTHDFWLICKRSVPVPCSLSD